MQNILDMKSLFENDKILIKQWSHYVCTLGLVCLWINEKIAMEFYTKLGILWPIEKRALVSGGWTRTHDFTEPSEEDDISMIHVKLTSI